ncbi:hypothetical protein J6590_048936 [Homalodisca vitripennis]|nr:hypothetical protein J6590_048936 [Homalodisca vitripennis]
MTKLINTTTSHEPADVTHAERYDLTEVVLALRAGALGQDTTVTDTPANPVALTGRCESGPDVTDVARLRRKPVSETSAADSRPASTSPLS